MTHAEWLVAMSMPKRLLVEDFGICRIERDEWKRRCIEAERVADEASAKAEEYASLLELEQATSASLAATLDATIGVRHG